MTNNYKKFLLFAILLLLFVSLGLEIAVFSWKNDSDFEVFFFDVGQGDATLVQYLDSYQILIDGGPSGEKLLPELSAAMPLTDRKIELVILTHPDKDHLGGLVDVFEEYSVGAFLHNGQDADTQIFAALKSAIESSGAPEYVFAEGSEVSIGELLLKSFNPDEALEKKNDRNENSIVLRMDYGENSFLLTGDADFATEKEMILDKENVDVDWLKVGHHGSKSSTSEDFLKLVTPEVAIISAGKSNRYGHPNGEVLERLKNIGTEIIRTDESGTITIRCENSQKLCTAE